MFPRHSEWHRPDGIGRHYPPIGEKAALDATRLQWGVLDMLHRHVCKREAGLCFSRCRVCHDLPKQSTWPVALPERTRAVGV